MDYIDNVADALKTIGVRLTDDFREYKSLPTVLGEISDKWDGLSKDDKDKICYSMAGDEDEVKARNCTEELNRIIDKLNEVPMINPIPLDELKKLL